MKRFISLILILSMLILIPFEGSAVNETSADDLILLPEKTMQTTELRTRKKVDGLRMYVDEENPLFMIRNCPIWGGPQTGEAFAEYAIKTYYALPEDIRNLAVFCIYLKNFHLSRNFRKLFLCIGDGPCCLTASI